MLNLRLASIRSSILVSKMASSTAAAQNRLGLEKSPYLLQHASNPVNWFPWGPEAFKVAKETNKPIFLSVGYSTCHWCHVMERESFKNQEIASFMNDHFVNIKMDREERPDVDKLYMSVITAMTGSGGWPLSVFLTPEGHPLTGATYLPPDDAFGQMGFRNILMLVSDAWKERREVITAQGRTMSEALKKAIQLPPTTVPPADVILKSTEQSVMQQYDKENAGFGIGPKFPKPVELDFLLYAYSIHRNKDTLEALEKTLHAIVLGGIHDHLDGGFHRYTVDKKWKVPHFEKMLYDQAQLLHIFATYYKVSHKYAEVIHGIVGYLKSNLAHPLGGFYSAEDAESIASNGTKSEGAYYTWSSKELKSILTDDEWKVARRYFNIEISGNIPAEADIRGELRDLNVLYVPDIPVEEIADSLDLSIEEFHTLLSSAKAKILEQRSKRQRPSTDTKIIASHNGLLISGLTAAYEAFPEKKEYLELAQKALGFVKKYLICPDTGKLLRTVYGDGEGVVNGPSKIPAFADDYASIIQACLDLYEADADDSHLRLAARLQQDMIEGYLSPQHGELPGGGFFYSRSGDPTLFARIQIDQDTSEPGFASVTTSNLLRLREYLGREDYDDMAHKVFASAGQMLEKASYAVPRMVRSIYAGEMGPTQILVKSNSKDCPKTTELLRTIRSFYLPDRSIIVVDKEGAGNAILEANPVVHTIVDSIKDDGPAVFLGRDGTYDTSSPLLTPQEVGEKLRSLSLKL